MKRMRFFCKRGYVNNCVDGNEVCALGCRIDGGQAEYVRVPYADQGLTVIPDHVSFEQALYEENQILPLPEMYGEKSYV